MTRGAAGRPTDGRKRGSLAGAGRGRAGWRLALSAAILLAGVGWRHTGRAGMAADEPTPCAATAQRSVAPSPVTVGTRVTVTAVIRIACPDVPGPVDVALAIDRSASMRGTSLAFAKAAADVFVDRVELGRTRVALVAFDDTAAVLVPLSSIRSRLHSAIARIEVPPAAGTDIVRALRAAGQELAAGANDGRTGRVQAIVLLSDGVNNRGPDAVRQQAAVQRGNDVHLTTVALGRRADVALLAAIAATPNDHWRVSTPEDLAGVYIRIAERLQRLGVRQLEIDDRIGATLSAWPGSALPEGTLAGDAQRWTIPAAAGEPITITYGLAPSATGRWPVSAFTVATFQDALGRPGSVAIPIPVLDVVAEIPSPTTVPSGTPTASASPTRRPTATATPATPATPAATPSATTTHAPTPPTPAGAGRVYLPIALAGGCLPGAAPLDLVVVLDASTTMDGRTASGRRKLDVAVEGIRRLVDGLDGRGDVRVALVRFDAAARIWIALTGDLRAVRAALAAQIDAEQGSRIDLGLLAAAEQLGPPNAARRRAVVLVSDGQVFGATEQDVLDAAAALGLAGAERYAVAVGPYAAEALLRNVTGAPERVFDAGDGDGFVRAFRAVGGALPCP